MLLFLREPTHEVPQHIGCSSVLGAASLRERIAQLFHNPDPHPASLHHPIKLQMAPSLLRKIALHEYGPCTLSSVHYRAFASWYPIFTWLIALSYQQPLRLEQALLPQKNHFWHWRNRFCVLHIGLVGKASSTEQSAALWLPWPATSSALQVPSTRPVPTIMPIMAGNDPTAPIPGTHWPVRH